MSPMIVLALAFGAIVVGGSLMVLVHDLIAEGVRRLRTAGRRPARRRRSRPRILT